VVGIMLLGTLEIGTTKTGVDVVVITGEATDVGTIVLGITLTIDPGIVEV
jgi:hypothetical protein